MASPRDTSPAGNGLAITPNDTASANAPVYRALYVGTSGDVKLRSGPFAQPVIYKSVPVGILPVNCQWVYSTGTTASNLIGLV
jgi:hypothetical protein